MVSPPILFVIKPAFEKKYKNEKFLVHIRGNSNSGVRIRIPAEYFSFNLIIIAETSGVGFLNSISLLRESMAIPVVANGDVRSLDDVSRVTTATGCHGVMAAR